MRIKGMPGETLLGAIERAVEACNSFDRECELSYGGSIVYVYPGSHERDIFDKWVYKRTLDDLAGVGT